MDGMDGDMERSDTGSWDLVRRLREVADRSGFAALGVVAADDLAGVPDGADPALLLPGYRAVVVLASDPAGVVPTGPTGPVMLDPALAEGMRRLRGMLEEDGWRSVPAGGTAVSLPRLAQAAGLGRVSPVGALVAAGHGLRLTLFAFVTDAPLATTSAAGRAGADPCLGCGRCTHDCPAMLPGSFDLTWCTACGVCVAVCPA